MDIKITGGTYGYRPTNKPGNVKPIRAGQTCDVPPEEAKRLVDLGVAEYAPTGAVATPPMPLSDNVGGNTTPDQGKGPVAAVNGVAIPDTLDIEDGHITEESLSTMTNAALAGLADDLGLDASKCKVKADYVALLTSVELDMAEQDGDGGDDDEPPTPSAELPV